MPTISGTFQVQLQALTPYPNASSGTVFGRMSIDKEFSGPLSATSQGEMLSIRSATAGSAGYVAMEQVVGSLEEKSGSFALQHFGTMQAGNSRLILEVVPDSGTEELSGLSGTMQIRMEEGEHFYDFSYELG
ncbi:MAG: DUF3224 domain-containing protein [Bacteroidota bacterium]